MPSPRVTRRDRAHHRALTASTWSSTETLAIPRSARSVTYRSGVPGGSPRIHAFTSGCISAIRITTQCPEHPCQAASRASFFTRPVSIVRVVHRSVEGAVARTTLTRFLPPTVIDGAHGDPAVLLRPRSGAATVLVSDIRGFTSWAEQRDPAEVLENLSEIQGALASCVARHRGTVDKFLGDGLLAVFGLPEAREDHASAAVACARDMLAEVDRINATKPPPGMSQLRIGSPPASTAIAGYRARSRSDEGRRVRNGALGTSGIAAPSRDHGHRRHYPQTRSMSARARPWTPCAPDSATPCAPISAPDLHDRPLRPRRAVPEAAPRASSRPPDRDAARASGPQQRPRGHARLVGRGEEEVWSHRGALALEAVVVRPDQRGRVPRLRARQPPSLGSALRIAFEVQLEHEIHREREPAP